MSHSRKLQATRPAACSAAVVMAMGVLVVVPAASAGTTAGGPPAQTVVLSKEQGTPVRTAKVPLRTGRAGRQQAGKPASPQRFDTSKFTMVAFTWKGAADPDLRFRTLSGGAWSAWSDAEPLVDGPTERSGEHRRARRTGASDLVWVGPASSIEVIAAGAVVESDLVLIDPGRLPADRPGKGRFADARTSSARTTSTTRAQTTNASTTLAGTTSTTTARTVSTTVNRHGAPKPRIRPRRRWSPNNSWRNGDPRYNRRLKQVHVHHTATHNDYKKRDVPALIRGMYSYHTRTLGWSDIGYNFLIDRFGRAWVGRAGGPGKLVRGAHTLGFNHASTGVSVIGNYETAQPTAKVIRRLVRVSAWKLDRHFDRAAGTVRVTSRGSTKFPAGTRVRLPVIDGHRDTGHTACPGENVYAALGEIRRRAQRRLDRF